MATCLLYLSLHKLHLSSCCLVVYIAVPTLPMSPYVRCQPGTKWPLHVFVSILTKAACVCKQIYWESDANRCTQLDSERNRTRKTSDHGLGVFRSTLWHHARLEVPCTQAAKTVLSSGGTWRQARRPVEAYHCTDSQVVELLAAKSFSAARLHLEHCSTLTGLQHLIIFVQDRFDWLHIACFEKA